jgi:hypothetical protein
MTALAHHTAFFVFLAIAVALWLGLLERTRTMPRAFAVLAFMLAAAWLASMGFVMWMLPA